MNSKPLKEKTLTVSKHKLDLTNLNKIFWPQEKITKGDLIEYYNTISTYILPYLKNRPQSLKRNPNGIIDRGFFQKDAGENIPDWINTQKIYSASTKEDVDYIVCNDKATLLYLSNLGCIEFNPWNSKVTNLDHPDYLILDIDPSEKNNFDQVVDVALAIKQITDRAGADVYCKTSGATGMHVYMPLNARYTYEQARSFAELLARRTHELLPLITTMERSLQKRGKDKIYIDYLQNSRGQTLASAYCLRPRPGAPVSAPLKWPEVKHGLRPEQFTVFNMARRIDKEGDLFRGVLGKGIDIKKSLGQLEK